MLYLCTVFRNKQDNNNNNDNNSNNKKTKREMTTNRIKVIGKIKGTSYRNTSVYGNPSYYITFEDEKGEEITGYTKPNADCAYGCTNSEFREFAYIVYHITKGGKVVIDNIFGKSVTE